MAAYSLPQTRLSKIVDPLIARIGIAASWIWVLLLAVVVLNVVLRYVFGEGRIEFEELQWHLYSVAFLIGISYAFMTDSHIRVDVLHEGFRPRIKAWIELYGIILLLLPFVVMMLIYSVPFTAVSFGVSEVSSSPGGLPYRWLIKAMLPIAFALMLAAALSRLSRVWSFLFGDRT